MRLIVIFGVAMFAIVVSWNGSVAGANPGKAGIPADGLRLSLNRGAVVDLEITFANTTTRPTVLNLGDMIGNGAQLWPTKFHLVVHNAAGDERRLHWKTGGIAGRVDAFLVPLMPGSKYTIAFSLTDLIGDGTSGNWSSTIKAGERVEAVYEGTTIDPTRESIPALPIWMGEAKSDSIVYHAK